MLQNSQLCIQCSSLLKMPDQPIKCQCIWIQLLFEEIFKRYPFLSSTSDATVSHYFQCVKCKTFLEPSQHIGVFPLQFPATKGAQLGSGYPETEYSRENVRESSRDLSRSGRERLRELRDRERQEVPEVKNRFLGEEQCECRNCQAERKYERKRRKKAEKISWN